MRLALTLAALTLALAVLPASAQALTFTVNSSGNSGDVAPGDGRCSTTTILTICTVRAAIEESNARAGRDRVTLGIATYEPTSELPEITDGADLTGAGARLSSLSAADAPGQPVLTINTAEAVSVTGLRITGATGAQGRGIHQLDGNVTLERVAVVGNEQAAATQVGGGGIRVDDGALVVRDSLIAGNTIRVTSAGDADAIGGGILTVSGTDLTLSNVTVSGNTAIANQAGGLNQFSFGAGIDVFDDALLEHVTLVGNVLGGNGGRTGANIATGGGQVTLRQSIIADGQGAPAATANCVATGGSIVAQGMNLETADTCNLPAAQLESTPAQLGALGNIGGPTDAHVPGPTSAAVGSASACAATTDQRGQPRPLGSGCELGAVERAADLDVTIAASSDTIGMGTDVIYTVTVRNTGPDVAVAPNVVLTPSTGSSAGAPVPSSGFCVGTNCVLPPLAQGTSAVILLTARPPAPGVVSLTASATSSTGDPDAADATATRTTTVLAPPSPGSAAEAAPPPALPGVAQGPASVPAPTPRCATTRLGTRKANRLTGGAASDRIRGGAGNDRIDGRGGPDCLFGEAGNDRVLGGAGDDELSGGDGRDTLDGGAGADKVSGGKGDDRVLARDRVRDRIRCGGGRDRVTADRVDVVAKDCERVSRR